MSGSAMESVCRSIAGNPTVIVLHHRRPKRRGTATPRCRPAIALIAGHVAASRHHERIVA
jgi:hypothetical protein